MPPPSCDISMPRPASRGSMYSSCASSTCSWPSRVRACCAKMSRISWVRSITRVLTSFSMLRCCEAVRSWSNRQHVGGIEAAAPAISSSLPLPIRVAGSGRSRCCRNLADDLGPGTVGQSTQLGQRLFGIELGNVRGHGGQLRGGTVASRLGGRGQLGPLQLGGCRFVGNGCAGRGQRETPAPGAQVPARRCAAPGVSGFADGALRDCSGYAYLPRICFGSAGLPNAIYQAALSLRSRKGAAVPPLRHSPGPPPMPPGPPASPHGYANSFP